MAALVERPIRSCGVAGEDRLREGPEILIPLDIGYDVATLTHATHTTVYVGNLEPTTGAVFLHTVEDRPQVGTGIHATTRSQQALGHGRIDGVLGFEAEPDARSLATETLDLGVGHLERLSILRELEQSGSLVHGLLNSRERVLVHLVVTDLDRLVCSAEGRDHAVGADQTEQAHGHGEGRGPIPGVDQINRGEDLAQGTGGTVAGGHLHGDTVLLEGFLARSALLRLLLAGRADGEALAHHALDDVGGADMGVAVADMRSSGGGECSGAGDFEFLEIHHANIIDIRFLSAIEIIESYLGSS